MLARLLTNLFPGRAGAERAAAGEARAAIDAYVASHGVRKLHLGAGPQTLPGWLGTDLEPQGSAVVRLDATRRFPIGDGVFDYVYSEHMIEHVPWQAGRAMLQECRRILRPGGRIRVATPDLAVLLALYRDARDAAADRYIHWITDHALPGIGTYKAAFVINNAFRAWGHQFLYDGELLESALSDAGFVDVRRYRYGESDDPQLRGIERHGRNIGDEDIAAFETMIFEAGCPS